MGLSRTDASATPSGALSRLEWAVALGLFALVSVYLVQIKLDHVDQQFGDTASFFQVLENIAFRGMASNQLVPSILAFLTSGMPTMHAAAIAALPLVQPPVPYNSMFAFHAYWILYPLAAFVRVFPSDVVLETAYVLCFTVSLFVAYIAARRFGLPGYAAVGFCLLIACHPAWATGLLGQFFPDRVFLVAGLLLMLVVSAPRLQPIALIGASLLCLSIDERAAFTAGLCLFAYAVLYFRRSWNVRLWAAGLGLVLIVYGGVMAKFFLPANFYNAGFLPSSLPALVVRFEGVDFRNGAILFLIVNGTFLILAAFEWRALLIALLTMVPNVIGNVGGAEKLGWSTHYHDEYLPILMWAALLGFVRAYRYARTSYQHGALDAALGALIVFLAVIDPGTGTFSLANVNNTFPAWFDRQAPDAFSAGAQYGRIMAAQMQQAIPIDAVVTTVEAGMAPLYRVRTLEFFPIGIDSADYAVLGHSGAAPAEVYAGVVDFLGPDETAKANALIVARMRRDGYDFGHPAYVGANGLAILKRVH